MPELPEVETVANGLRKYVVGKTITKLVVHEHKKFKGTATEIKKFVLKKKIVGVDRKAKWLVVNLNSGYGFVIHLKMTGQLLYTDKQPKFLGGHTMGKEQTTLPNNHTRVEFIFTDGSKLFFQDMRKFGYVELYPAADIEHYFIQKKLGIEPIEPTYTFDYFCTVLQKRKRTSIKAVLLNQQAIAGIGNIYADDICWQARVKPTRRVSTLTRAEQRALYQASHDILREAIKLGGTSFSHYYRVDGKTGSYWNKRKVYDRTGEPCRRCKTIIKKTRCAGRGTHFCPTCQH
ncbi:MAG: bifunctional DNA-formamidopyrimidine glycosylase/DNA-(apurinic or apyrimidinic site) lyase [Candidatus Kerfeldbacteria bacterium]|nr:bifunctional DNA-formamidopyrimidine glycosylase/DNA-(apurinic or apyrimidinic site) lyase [Candidatus Kerfeldbacteria bacterium]